MRRKIYSLAALLFFFCHIAFGQEIDYSAFKGKAVSSKMTLQIPEARFHVYPEESKAYAIYTHQDSTLVSSPEELLSALLSANNLNWYSSYFKDPALMKAGAKELGKRAPHDSSAYYLLEQKFSYQKNNVSFYFIKARFYTGKKYEKSEIFSISQGSKGWQITRPDQDYDEVLFLLRIVNADILRALLRNEKTDDKDIRKLIKDTRVDLSGLKDYMDISKAVDRIKTIEKENIALYRKITSGSR